MYDGPVPATDGDDRSGACARLAAEADGFSDATDPLPWAEGPGPDQGEAVDADRVGDAAAVDRAATVDIGDVAGLEVLPLPAGDVELAAGGEAEPGAGRAAVAEVGLVDAAVHDVAG